MRAFKYKDVVMSYVFNTHVFIRITLCTVKNNKTMNILLLIIKLLVNEILSNRYKIEKKLEYEHFKKIFTFRNITKYSKNN